MPDYTRNYQFEMPEGPDSLVGEYGLAALTTWADQVDSQLASVAAMGTDPALFFGQWDTGTNFQTIGSSATLSNITIGLTNRITFAGTGTPTVNTANGDITFTNPGMFRLTINASVGIATPNTEAQLSFGLKPSGVGTYVNRCSYTAAIPTFVTINTRINKSFVLRAASTGGDVDLTTTYKIGFQQTNTAAFNFTYGSSTLSLASWFTIEYLRPVT